MKKSQPLPHRNRRRSARHRAKRKANIYTADEDIAQWRRVTAGCDGDLCFGGRAGVRLFWADPGKWVHLHRHGPPGRRLYTHSLMDVSAGMQFVGTPGYYLEGKYGVWGMLALARLSVDIEGLAALTLEIGGGCAPNEDLAARGRGRWR